MQWSANAVHIQVLLVPFEATLVKGRVITPVGILVAPETESLHQGDQLGWQIYELDPGLFAETTLPIKFADAGPAHDVIQAVRALLRLHVGNHEREANTASQQLLQRGYFVVDFVVAETHGIA